MRTLAVTITRTATADSSWWKALNEKEQAEYLKLHPKSRLKPTSHTEGSLTAFAKSKFKSVTADQIYAKLNATDAEEIKSMIEKANRQPQSTAQYSDGKGNYTEERLQLHQEIVDHFLNEESIARATPKAGQKPRVVVLGGRGGSGKSAFTASKDQDAKIKEFDSREFIVLDPDAIKERLKPPYAGWNACSVHEESSDISKRILDTATMLGLNIVLDQTLKSDKTKDIEELTRSGYEAEGHFMYLPAHKAAERACHRYLSKGPGKRGRLVPPEVVLGNVNNEANFDKLKKVFTRWSAYDNDQPKGQPPKLIERSK